MYVQRVVYTIDVEVANLIDLTGDGLAAVGLTMNDVQADDHESCRRVGGAAAWLGRGGLLIPSARFDGHNLVIFIDTVDIDADFRVINREIIDRRTGSGDP